MQPQIGQQADHRAMASGASGGASAIELHAAAPGGSGGASMPLPAPVVSSSAAAAAAAPAAGAAATTAQQVGGGGLTVAPFKKAIAVQGDTKAHKERLKQLGGRWNRPLAAWVFPGPKQAEVVAALREAGIAVAVSTEPLTVSPPVPAPAAAAAATAAAGEASGAGARHTLSVERYKKALLVKGDTKPVKETLKSLGGKWSSLGGFIFGGKQKTTRKLLARLRADPAITLCLAEGVESGAPDGNGAASQPAVAPAAPAPRERPDVDASQVPPLKRVKQEPPPEPVEEWVTPKDPNKPKRPMSSFFYFSKTKRSQVLEQRPEMARQMGEIAKLAGAEWKTMDLAARAPYTAMAVLDQKRYQTEMATYTPLPKVLVIHKQQQKKRQQNAPRPAGTTG
jgi:hypothetical protein